jgi:hypothetical protein
MPEGFYQDWHPASRRPASRRVFWHTVGRNQRREEAPVLQRRVFLADDVGSRGNRTRTIGGPAGCCSFICRPKPISALDRFRSLALTPGLRFMQIYPDTPRPDHIRSLQKFEKVG